MRQYFKNVLRTILQNKISYIGAILIIAMGTMVYITMSEFMNNLDIEAKKYFEECNFADVFVTVGGMPKGDLNRLESIEGVNSVFGRLEGNVRFLTDAEDKIVTLHIQAYSPEDTMNQLTIEPYSDMIGDDEIYLSPKIAQVYGIEKGDFINVVAKGSVCTLRCVGYGYSPEYMNAVADESMMTADSSVYDTAVMSVSGLEKLLGKTNVVTNIGIMLTDGYIYADVYRNIEQMLSMYSLEEICEKTDQSSYDAIDGEVEAYEMLIAVVPAIFMAVTAFMLYIILKKAVDKDRILIGTMKAFGASNAELLKVYIVQAVFIGLVGSVLLAVPAEMAAQYLFEDDMIYYNIPGRTFHYYIGVWTKAILLDVTTALLAVMIGVADVIRINPAESMRSQPPAGGDIKLPMFIQRILNPRQKLGIMSVLRNKARSLVIAVAIALPFAMTAIFPAYNVVSDQSVYDQFGKIEMYDIKVKLNGNIPYEEAESILRSLEGVSQGEVICSYGIKVRGTNKYEYAPLLILNNDSQLYKIMDYHGNYFEPRDDGLIISHHLADMLHVKTGDLVEVEADALTYADNPVKMMIVGVVEDTFGINCYLSGDGAEKYFPVKRQGNLLLIDAEPDSEELIAAQLNKLRNIGYIVDSQKAADDYVEMMAITMLILNFVAIFSVVAGVLMIYNIMSIGVRERKNEFGTLMVLGMSNSEISEIVLFEQIINFGLGIILGIPCAQVLKEILQYAVNSDEETLLIQITPSMYIFSFVLCAGAAAVSLVLILRELFQIELTDVLKARE